MVEFRRTLKCVRTDDFQSQKPEEVHTLNIMMAIMQDIRKRDAYSCVSEVHSFEGEAMTSRKLLTS